VRQKQPWAFKLQASRSGGLDRDAGNTGRTLQVNAPSSLALSVLSPDMEKVGESEEHRLQYQGEEGDQQRRQEMRA